MYEPMISIVIPVYNGSNYLEEAINSALNQTYKNCEIIVVDDGSCDNGKTQSIIQSYGNQIRAIKKQNGGVATALNLAINNMNGEYFAWLSHDDLLKMNAMEVYINRLQSLDNKCVLYGNYDLIDENSIIYNSVDMLSRFTREQLQLSVYPVIRGCVNGCACLIHKSHFDRVGLFDENLKITQDNDMWFRIFRDSKIYFCEEYLSSKRYHLEQDSVTKNVYPDEDAYVENCLKQLSLLECSRFGGTVYQFFDEIFNSFNDNKHPLVIRFCNQKKEEILSGSIYQNASVQELIEIVMNGDKLSNEISNKCLSIQREYMKYILRF